MESNIIKLLSIKKSNNLSSNEIADKLGVKVADVEEELNDLIDRGIIFKNKGNRYMLVANTSLKKGIVKVTKRKGPIVILEDNELSLVFNSHQKVENNDIVLVEPYYKSGKAQVVSVLNKREKDYIGEVIKDDNFKITAKGKKDILIKKPLPIGTKVLVNGVTGEIKEILGNKEELDVTAKELLIENGFPISFSDAYLEELAYIPMKITEEMKLEALSDGVYDLTDVNLVTIDGIDTKDFDDAVGFENNTLYISIADIEHFVKEGSIIDKETINRGISVYPPGMVNPMMHHRLSNGICSLDPNEDRIGVTLIVKYDNNGNILNVNISKAVIKSKMRMTYEDVNLFLEEGNLLPEYEKYTDMLNKLYDIAMVQKNKMLNEGFLEFSSTEVKFFMDSINGNKYHVSNVKQRHNGKAEELIEFLMLLYNLTLTDYFIKHDLPFIARNHDKPNNDKVTSWNKLLSQRGYNTEIKDSYSNDDIKKSLKSYENAPEKIVLDDRAIKSQSKARFSANSKGHFGLGVNAYLMMSSPIRRLADNVNQRIFIDSLVYGDKYSRNKWESRIEELANICTDSEKRADKVERKMDDIYKAKYMANDIGGKYTGFVSGVGHGYIKVLLPNMVTGIIYISSKDYELSKDGFSLYSNKTVEKILVGDSINVEVSSVNIETGEVKLLRQDIKYKECSYEKEKKGYKKKKKNKSR